jgi:NAD(P)-dependent dehydrogenase (short-subunit alcohol dehydrogenase family)
VSAQDADAARLDGRVVLVTGGSSGIGRATALALGRAGAIVVVSSRRLAECERVAAEIAAAGGTASAAAADVTQFDAMERLVADVLALHGRLDGAFNNAGRILGVGALHETDPAGFRAAFDLNAGGVFNALRTQLPPMIRAGRGAIVVNTALSGLRPRATIGLYSAAKAAAVQLACVAAQEAAPHGVRVNAIAPGYVGSEAWFAKLGPQAPALAAGVPQRRIGRPDEVADAVVWLLSDRASYVNGAVLPIDGGLALA